MRRSTGAAVWARDAAGAVMIVSARTERRRAFMGLTLASGLTVSRHCEERSDEAIHSFLMRRDGLLRCARNDGGAKACLLPYPFFRSKNALNAATASFECMRSPNKS